VAEQHDVAQVLIFDDVEDIRDVGFQIDRRVGQMRPLAKAGVARRHQPMPGRQHQRVHLLPRPSGRPRAVADEKGGVHESSPLAIATGTL
jgi:hypothetical protein